MTVLVELYAVACRSDELRDRDQCIPSSATRWCTGDLGTDPALSPIGPVHHSSGWDGVTQNVLG